MNSLLDEWFIKSFNYHFLMITIYKKKKEKKRKTVLQEVRHF